MEYIKDIAHFEKKEMTLQGWVANKRESKGIAFVVLRDGSGFIQTVISAEQVGESQFEEAQQLTLESSVELTGKVVKDERQMGGFELQVSKLKIYQIAEDYPIAKKEHGVDFLMDKRHLWLRSKKQWAVMRVRNEVVFAIHSFFQERGFMQMDAPIFTGNACEGTSDLFETDFYGQPAYLSQSGQLYGEAMAMAQGLIYTFGPTFRAEKSKTRRHLSEFWMIEPEMAFYDNNQNMDLIEEFTRYVVKRVVENCREHLELLDRNVESLEAVDQTFPRISYTEAVAILKGEKEVDGRNSLAVLQSDLEEVKKRMAEIETDIAEREELLAGQGIKKGVRNFNLNKVATLKAELAELREKEENIPQWMESAKNFEWGNDFGGSDETVLTRLFETPIMVHDWPKDIKAFYMKRNEQDENLVKGVDVLAPEGFGEIVGGGERETNKDFLIAQIKKHDLPMEAFEWYLDLRRYGAVPHAGFGLGLERFVQWMCGLHHIRETVPLPRMYGRLFP